MSDGKGREGPESGFRIEVQRAQDGGPPWTYDGHAISPTAAYGVSAVVERDGSVRVQLADGAPSRLVTKVAAVVRAACGASEPPARIVAWRSDGSRG
jgi:hypothetical protein